MPASLHPVDALRIVMDALLKRDDPASAMVGTAINGMLHDGLTFEAGMGLAPGWRVAERLRQRDDALRELAQRYFLGLCGRRLAAAVAHAVRHYETTAWPRDRAARHRPDGRAGAVFDVLMAGGDVPGERQLRNILGNLGCVAISQSAA